MSVIRGNLILYAALFVTFQLPFHQQKRSFIAAAAATTTSTTAMATTEQTKYLQGFYNFFFKLKASTTF